MLEEAPGARETLVLMEESGALLSGHFVLSSGLHSDKYVQCARLLESPRRAETVGRNLAGLVEASLGAGLVECIANPALGGLIIGHEAARALGARCVFLERSEGAMALRRGFEIKKGERVLIVEDVITTGLSTSEVLKVVAQWGGKPVGVACIVNRSPGVEFGVPLTYLVRAAIQNYQPADCPMCSRGIELVKPGSRQPPTSAL
jgi:orotate phosphoribosyltransferase